MKHSAGRSGLVGFSLVELSIVLVILGLLVGGILSGQSLIRASELRSVSTEYQKYATAIGTFRDKYFGLPGDLNNADTIWTTVGKGDGDGVINLTATANTNEVSLFWLHLSNAGLIEGSYTNVAAASVTACGTMTPGTNNPKAKISFGGWNVLGLGTVTDASAGNLIYYNSSYGNALLLGGGTTCGTATAMAGIVKSEEAWNIDTKIDDGKPDTGSMLVFESQGAATPNGCGDVAANAVGPTGVDYDLANPSKTACAMIFKTGY